MASFKKRYKNVRQSFRKGYQAIPKAIGLRQKAASYGQTGPQYSETARSRSAGAGTVDFTEGAWS